MRRSRAGAELIGLADKTGLINAAARWICITRKDAPDRSASRGSLNENALIRIRLPLLLERYIVREIVAPQATVCAVLVTIFTGYSMTRFLNDVVNGLLSIHLVAVLVMLRVLISLEVLLPATLYLGIIFALGRLYADGEILAMEATGIGRKKIIKAVLLLALPVAVIVAGLSLYGRPWAYAKIYEVESNARKEFDFSKIEAGRFYELGKKLVFFTEKFDSRDQQAYNVYIWRTTSRGRDVTFARRAYHQIISGQESIIFVNGCHYQLDLEKNRNHMVAFEKNIMHLKPVSIPYKYRRKAASIASLHGSDNPEDIAEFQWRLSTGPATVLLALLALPLSRVGSRRGKYAKANIAVILFFIYYNFSLIAKTWVETRVIPAMPGIWWIHLLLAATVLILSGCSDREWPLHRRRRTRRTTRNLSS